MFLYSDMKLRNRKCAKCIVNTGIFDPQSRGTPRHTFSFCQSLEEGPKTHPSPPPTLRGRPRPLQDLSETTLEAPRVTRNGYLQDVERPARDMKDKINKYISVDEYIDVHAHICIYTYRRIHARITHAHIYIHIHTHRSKYICAGYDVSRTISVKKHLFGVARWGY